ncbi:hypothetical protein KN10_2186 [Anoxybacillus flavithermus NBRC 109594]|uniref:Uncharacterized protein n=1 Tax=Anoxybacillus flavithermus NBRC 109594 TaxID=1315967 RepID=R4FFW7_9BACL|nr:beta-L-arabinofuranosidase domain-containing protein [Anoxybacillus flavithermus]GAC91750.1 hypothetical protein KN10_2186 [Anoxybacillus flavithermus NBRC 109594]
MNKYNQILQDAVSWLKEAQDRSGSDGIAGWYDFRKQQYSAAYPETTGYIIGTLLRYGQAYEDEEAISRAIRAAKWLIEIQDQEGWIPAGLIDAKQGPAVFNTGMVLQGLLDVYVYTGDSYFLSAACKAGDWLLHHQEENGAWIETSAYTDRESLAYHVLIAWVLFRLTEIVDDPRYCKAAEKNVDWCLELQRENGYFEKNHLRRFRYALTHTIGYVLQGLAESSVYYRKTDCLHAVEKVLVQIDTLTDEDGFLSGEIDSSWKPIRSWACLTGNAQIAGVAMRMRVLGARSFEHLAKRLNHFCCQVYGAYASKRPAGLHGCHPVVEDGYMFSRVPNWAVKYLIDSLMLELGGGKYDICHT